MIAKLLNWMKSKMYKTRLRKKLIEEADKKMIKHGFAIVGLLILTYLVCNINFSPGVIPVSLFVGIYLQSIFSKDIEIIIDGFIQNIYDFLNGNILRDNT